MRAISDSRKKILEVNNLSMYFYSGSGKSQQVVKAVDDVTFHIYQGETFGLVGESGCGKTTTGRSIIRLYTPTSGEMFLDGEDISGPMNSRLRRYITDKVAMIFQDPVDSLNPRMTVREIIGEGLEVRGIKDKAVVDEKVYSILNKVGLTREHATRYPHEFSGGQRQRIGIARAIVVEPAMVIADEPVSALDVSIQAQVINLLGSLKEDLGLTILFIAHDLSVVKHFSDRIGVMYYGKLVEVAEADELYDNPIHPYTRALLSAIPHPNPLSEKRRRRITYDGLETHDYSVEQPSMVEILPEHFVYCSPSEAESYRREFKRK